MEPPIRIPVHELPLVAIACRPDEPLEPGDPRYADFEALRRGVGVTLVQNALRLPVVQGKFHHRCLCGHRGSGKSTELLRLKEWADGNGFLALHVEVDAHYGAAELEFSDLFLLAAATIEEAMARIGHPLPAAKVRRVTEWFADVIQEDRTTFQGELTAEAGAQVGGTLPFGLGKLFAKCSARLRAGSEQVTTARKHLRNYPDVLVELTNDLLACANEILRGQGYARGALLLFDNLDRYEPECIHRVLFRSGTLVDDMACHIVFTIPIALEYDPPGPIHDQFGPSVVLPMLSLRPRQWSWGATVAESSFDEGAVESVVAALARRMDVDALFEDSQDARWLVKMSGGCIRDLMHLVTLALTYAGDVPRLPTSAVRRSIRELRALYIRRLTDEQYARLVQIARREAVPRDKITRQLLFNRYALEYRDDKDEPWIDIHPLVLEVETFRDAYDRAGSIARA